MSCSKIRPGVKNKRGKLLWCSLLAGLCLLAFYLQQKNQSQQAASELAQLQRNAQRINTLRRNHPPGLPAAASLPALLQTTAKKHGVLLGRLPPDLPTLDVALPPQPLKPLLLWLGSLQQEYGMRVDVVDLSLSEEGDIVTVKRLSLQAPSIR
ncbi:type II secretion system protein M [Serratia proteamaculans]|uniref:Type II secretion system protein M n=1 Tax=Serratia proteamaculans TaxID=28151 RepID=A0A7U0N2E6_SERPR|nr:type II secretion system protein GspM [Serratia proteamaculans]MBO1502429.1 type II secretion system protein M [Serratia proteamaculans]MDW5511036.1 type II secretion system protein GspM [Serratia proteamaculans]QQX51254.1 type II secretion system protein M [Serratia proteamaculans]HCV64482.1 hypothetical protein [Serratia sp. (in: enterobacteria)]